MLRETVFAASVGTRDSAARTDAPPARWLHADVLPIDSGEASRKSRQDYHGLFACV